MDTAPATESTALLSSIEALLQGISLMSIAQAALWLVAGVLSGWLLGRLAERAVLRGGNLGLADLARRAVKWLIITLGLALALDQLGFNLGVLFGAAGVASIALGFAAQTSVSNLISGVFLLGEQAVKVGDMITVGATSGEVLSVDLLSVKLRTFDNRLVRVPNEQLIKTEVINLSAFPLRRIELVMTIPPWADLDAVRDLLIARAAARTDVLHEPAPAAFLGPFGPDGLDLKFCCWARREQFMVVQTAFYREVRQALLDQGYQFSAPRRVLLSEPGRATPVLHPALPQPEL